MKYSLPIFIIISFPFLVSCGLEDNIDSINPPHYSLTNIGEQYFQIKITDDNDEDYFRGIEFYYKFYSKDTSPSLLEINLDTHDDLVAANFKRLSSSTDSINNYEKPLVPVQYEDRGYESTITVDFSDFDTNNHPYIYAVPDSGNTIDLFDGKPYGLDIDQSDLLEIYRETTYSYGDINYPYCKPFNDMNKDDSDLSHITQDFATEKELKILLYAISYGKYDLTTKLYSKAVCLQYINIDFTHQ